MRSGARCWSISRRCEAARADPPLAIHSGGALPFPGSIHAICFNEHGGSPARPTFVHCTPGHPNRPRVTGVGLARGVRAKIFDSFRQADGSTTRRFGGTGLGLSISASLARLMGGDLLYERVDGSTVFRLRLPSFD